MLINSPFPYHYRAWNSPCIFIHYVRFFITFSNFSPTKLQYIKPVDFDIWHTIKILTHYNCTAVFSQTLHRPCRWHLGTPNACALDVIESLHEVSSATDDVDNVLWFPREVWFRCSCTFARSSLVFQSVFHSLDANVVSLAQIWYDFFCEVLWRDLLKTYFLEHTFCFAFSAWFSLKRKILCYACFDSRSICFLVFTFFNLFHSQEVTYVTWYHYLVLTPRSSRRGKPTRELWIASYSTRPVEQFFPLGITRCLPQDVIKTVLRLLVMSFNWESPYWPNFPFFACLPAYLRWGLFLERPGNLTGPKSYFKIKVSRKVGCVLTYNEVHFVSLAVNFTVQLSNLLKLSSGMENKTP